MNKSNEDLWPTEFTEEPADRAPLLILREQAARLGDKTANLVEGRVSAEPMPDGSGLLLQLTLVAPALGDYEYVLLRAVQPIDLYPVKMEFEGSRYEASDEQGFKLYLENLFKSQRTRRIVSSLVAQSRSA